VKTIPTVSVIIPTYNRASVICDAVESVLNQSYSNVDLIVVDDGSKDDTHARLRRFGNRIRLITQDNAGPAAARNRGIAVSRGDLVAFLDSDDLWLPSKVERQVSLLGRLDVAVTSCLCNIQMKWSDKEFGSFDNAWLNPAIEEGVWLNVDEVLATRFVLFNQGIMVRRHVLERIGGFDEDLRLLEDADLALRLSLVGPWAFIQTPLAIWRETRGSCYQNAQLHQVGLNELQVKVLERQLGRVKRDYQHKEVLVRELKRARRQLGAAKIRESNSISASVVSKSLRIIEGIRGSLFRRSPWFPQMKVRSSTSWKTQG
jgi:glycosyltransferase involved in cell wall biosynthesis